MISFVAFTQFRNAQDNWAWSYECVICMYMPVSVCLYVRVQMRIHMHANVCRCVSLHVDLTGYRHDKREYGNVLGYCVHVITSIPPVCFIRVFITFTVLDIYLCQSRNDFNQSYVYQNYGTYASMGVCPYPSITSYRPKLMPR